MDFHINGYILIVIAVLEIILGFYILLKYQLQKVPFYYLLFIFSVVIWVFSNGIYILSLSDFWGNLTFVGATLLAAFFLVFTWVFPYEDRRIGINKKWLLILPVIFFSVTIYVSDLFIKDYGNPFVKGSRDIFGPIYYLFAVYIFTCFVWGIKVLIDKYKKSDGIHRWQLKYLLIGVVISSIFGITFNLIFPLFGTSSYGTYGPASSAIWLAFTTYIILKK